MRDHLIIAALLVLGDSALRGVRQRGVKASTGDATPFLLRPIRSIGHVISQFGRSPFMVSGLIQGRPVGTALAPREGAPASTVMLG